MTIKQFFLKLILFFVVKGVTVIPPTNSTDTSPAPVLAVASPQIPPPSTVPLPPTGQPLV